MDIYQPPFTASPVRAGVLTGRPRALHLARACRVPLDWILRRVSPDASNPPLILPTAHRRPRVAVPMGLSSSLTTRGMRSSILDSPLHHSVNLQFASRCSLDTQDPFTVRVCYTSDVHSGPFSSMQAPPYAWKQCHLPTTPRLCPHGPHASRRVRILSRVALPPVWLWRWASQVVECPSLPVPRHLPRSWLPRVGCCIFTA